MRSRTILRAAGAAAALLCTLAWHAPAPAQTPAAGDAYLQYRTYESDPSANDGFRAWIDFTADGRPVGEGDIASVRLLDPWGNEVAPQALTFLRNDFFVATADAGGVFSWWGPYGTSGFLLDLRNRSDLTAGSYLFEAQAADGTLLGREISFPGPVPLNPVPAWTMGYGWQTDGSLSLWWGYPGDFFDEYRIVLTAAPNREIFVGRVDPWMQSVTLPPGLVAAITPLVDPATPPRWRVQTRLNGLDGMNYARSYSGPVGIPDWPEPPPPPPANDAFARAEVIPGTPFAGELDARGATADWAEDPWLCYEPRATVWYAFTPAQDLFVTVDTAGSTYRPALTVLRGAPSSFVSVVCGADRVEFRAQAGQTYYLMIGAAEPWNPVGQLKLTVDGRSPLDVALALDPTGSFDSATGVATVSGTVTCNVPARAYVSGLVRQTVGRRSVIEAYFGTEVACDGATRWSAAAMSSAGSFAGGQTLVRAHAGASAPGEDDQAEASATIRLTGAAKGKK